MNIVTSMSLKGYEEYGKAFLASAEGKRIPEIYVYSEDDLPIPHCDLNNDPEWREFQKGPGDGPDWRWQAKRFSHKVFAITRAASKHEKWRIWLDADVEFTGDLDDEFLKRACPENATLSYLGRKDMKTSECGWVAYNLHNGGREFLKRFREIYTSGKIYDHHEWHDSYIFDRVMEELPGNYRNLSEDVPGMHVWDSTVLGECMKHLKGPLRKKGASLENLPEDYRSEKE